MASARVNQGPLEDLRLALETLNDCMPPEASPDLPEAVRGFMAAIDYKDNVLLRSRYEAMGLAFVDTADRAIEKAADGVQRAREACRKVKSLNGPPDEQFDDLGKTCQAMFERLLQGLAAIKDGWVRVAQVCDHEVPRAVELESLTREVVSLQESTLTGWPWTSLGLPPVDRTMVAESRAAYARGEGEPIQNWIEREANHSTRG